MRKIPRPTIALFLVSVVTVAAPGSSRADETCSLFEIEDGDTVDIKGSGPEWRACLMKAVGTPRTVVRLGPDVDMDMTGVATPIDIVGGVTLTSVARFDQPSPATAPPPRGVTGPVRDFSRRPAATTDPGANTPSRPEAGPPAAVADPTTGGPPPMTGAQARSPRALGPRLWTKDKPAALFQIRCFVDGAYNDSVRISGFRLEGAEKDSGSTGSSIGIDIRSCIDIAISNMEISGWSNSGIRAGDKKDFENNRRLISHKHLRISDSFFHHNQHKGGFGYGVNPQAGTIERNVFDFNRHAISTGGDAIGYVAARNLVLKGGGFHGYGAWYTHQFDVHGTDNCWPSEFNCGEAGTDIHFIENTFQYRHDHAIGIRGTPRTGAYIYRNIFAHDDVRDPYLGEGGVKLYEGDTRITFGTGSNANLGGKDTFGKYGVCDFDGDGKDDLFLPTGVTWWFAAEGRFHWSHLNALGGSIGDLRLGYFDDDARCDVLTDNGRSWMISSGGITPWRRFATMGTRLSEVALGRFDMDSRDQRPNASRKTTHAFRTREGQWEVTSLATPDWQRIQGSHLPVNKLRFGDFTGDGVTDVLAVEGGRWSISEGGRGGWSELNPTLGDDLSAVFIADLDNNNRDDIARLVIKIRPAGPGGIQQTWDLKWEVSWDGRTPWRPLQDYRFTLAKNAATVFPSWGFAGRFDTAPGADLLVIDPQRQGHFVNKARGKSRSIYPF